MEVARKTPIDTRMSRRANVACHMIDILRNTTQKECGPHERLGFASKGTTFRARVARRNRIPRNNWVRDSILRGTATGYTSGRRRQLKLECSKGVRSRDVEEPLHPRKGSKTANGIGGWSGRQQTQLDEEKSNRTYRKTTGLEIE